MVNLTEATDAEFIAELEHRCNRYGSSLNVYLKRAVPNWHRTIQQRFAGFIKAGIEVLAEQDTDARNETSVKWAKDCLKLREDGIGFPCI